MTQEELMVALFDDMSEQTAQALGACCGAELALPNDQHLPPARIMAICDAFGAQKGPVLALLGWVRAEGDRSNLGMFYDLLDPDSPGVPRYPTDRETRLALGLGRLCHAGA